jgi:hypothetical protein
MAPPARLFVVPTVPDPVNLPPSTRISDQLQHFGV